MISNLTRPASLAVAILLLGAPASHAGYDITISHSSTDPDVNVSASAVGVDSLFLWVKCAEEGLAAVDLDLVSDMTILGFEPSAGIINARSSSSLLLALGGCPAGDSTGVVLGRIYVSDPSGGYIRVEASSANADLVVASCDSTGYSAAYIPRAVGFRSDGNPPDTTGAEYGCGFTAEMLPSEFTGSLGFTWSDDYGAPPSGDGADSTVTRIHPLAFETDAYLVAGRFKHVGGTTVPNLAKLTSEPDNGTIVTTWSLPGTWGALSPLADGTWYGAAVSTVAGALALGSTDANRPFVYCPPSGSCIVTGPPVDEATSLTVDAVVPWSGNGRFLVGGNFQNGLPPESYELHGLGQYNAATSTWEYFGYPNVGTNVQYYVEFDGFGGEGYVSAMKELHVPNGALDGAVVLSGSFQWIFGVDWSTLGDLTFQAKNFAWLLPDGTFDSHGSTAVLAGPALSLVQSPGPMAGDGGQYLYAAGIFGYNPINGGDRPSVLAAQITGAEPSVFLPLTPGGPPWDGPAMSGLFNAPTIHELWATDEHLYAIGDFDRVLTVAGPGGVALLCDGLARFSFAAQTWQTEQESEPALDDTGRAIAVAATSFFVGGDFDSAGGIPSHRFGRADFDAPVGVRDGWSSTSPRAPVMLGVPQPNPSGGGMHVGFSLPVRGEVDVRVFDVAGRRVRQLVIGFENAGEHLVQWDGKDGAGERVSPGVYFVRLRALGEERVQKLTIVR